MTAARASSLIALLAWTVMTSACRSSEDCGLQGENQERIVMGQELKVHYLEFVTEDVEETCSALSATHGVQFGEPIMALGNARTAKFHGGALLGVRAPMSETEEPIVRPYFLVSDIQAAVEIARSNGAEIALPPMELPGQGQCAIYILGGIQYGFWQN